MKKLMVLALVMLCMGCAAQDVSKATVKGEPNEDGDYTVVSVSYSKAKDKVVDINIDEVTGGVSKKELGSDYGMKAASGVNREWDEQMHYLETFIKDYSIEELLMNEYGVSQNPDVVSGCTVYIGHIVPLVEQAINEAKR